MTCQLGVSIIFASAGLVDFHQRNLDNRCRSSLNCVSFLLQNSIGGLWIEATPESVRDAESEDTALLKLIDLAHIASLLSTRRRWQPTAMRATHYPTGVDGY